MNLLDDSRECAGCGRFVDLEADHVYLEVFSQVEEEAETSGFIRRDFVYRCPGCRTRREHEAVGAAENRR